MSVSPRRSFSYSGDVGRYEGDMREIWVCRYLSHVMNTHRSEGGNAVVHFRASCEYEADCRRRLSLLDCLCLCVLGPGLCLCVSWCAYEECER